MLQKKKKPEFRFKSLLLNPKLCSLQVLGTFFFQSRSPKSALVPCVRRHGLQIVPKTWVTHCLLKFDPRGARCFSEVPGHMRARAREANEPSPLMQSNILGELDESIEQGEYSRSTPDFPRSDPVRYFFSSAVQMMKSKKYPFAYVPPSNSVLPRPCLKGKFKLAESEKIISSKRKWRRWAG